METQFKEGEKILVSFEEINWRERTFIAYVPQHKHRFLCINRMSEKGYKKGKPVSDTCFWKYAKKLKSTTIGGILHTVNDQRHGWSYTKNDLHIEVGCDKIDLADSVIMLNKIKKLNKP